jgi:tRNA pseudouridine38-40 synthase
MKMRNIKITIQYDGSRYQGWQRLSASDLTIQGKLEDVISKMTGEETSVIGSGRTDAGVHSRGQTANFKTTSAMPLQEMKVYMNHYLPKDIVVWKINDTDERFHSRYNVKSKKYAYYIWTGEFQPPFVRKYSWHHPDHIDSAKMVEASKKILGTHDFIGFSSLKKSKKSTIRTIDSIEIRNEGMMLVLEFTGEGFLHNMVRILAGTLVDIGTGRIQSEKIDEIFETGVRADAGITLPPHGLFLEQVRY